VQFDFMITIKYMLNVDSGGMTITAYMRVLQTDTKKVEDFVR